jgi:TPR repeat protein
LLYEEGQGSIPKDYAKSQKLLAKSAKLNYAKAIEKITFEGDK